MAKDMTVRMVNYNHVRETATIAYISPKGTNRSVYIHKHTFLKLMSGELERSTIPGDLPSLDQKELKDALVKEIDKDYKKWFVDTANELSRKTANARA